MSAVPTWLGATSGQAAQSGQINQLLGAHTSQYLYAAVQTAGVTAAGATSTPTNSTWLAQSFTTAVGQTSIGYVIVPLRTVTASGGTLAPTTLSLYANSGGAPTGSALASVTVTAEYAFTAVLNTPIIYPLPVTGLTASTTYWLVTPAAGSATPHYNWYRSTAASTASTSTNGTTWTPQTYGFQYQIFDQTASGQMTCTWEDSGARWTASTYNATTGALATYAEYTVAQGTAQYVQGLRTLSYSSGLLTKAV